MSDTELVLGYKVYKAHCAPIITPVLSIIIALALTVWGICLRGLYRDYMNRYAYAGTIIPIAITLTFFVTSLVQAFFNIIAKGYQL